MMRETQFPGKAKMFVDVLPWWERCIYWIVGISGIAYSIFILFLEGEKLKNSLTEVSLSPGWSWLGRDQDQSDIEWWVWRSELQKIIFLNAIHVLLSQTCFYLKVSVKLHSCVLLIFDIAAAYIFLDLRIVVLQFCMALTMYAAALLGSISLVWLVEVAMISSLNFNVFYEIQTKYLKFLNFEKEYQFHVVCAFFHIRLISFAIEKIKYRKSQAAMTKVAPPSCEIEKCEQIKAVKSCDKFCESVGMSMQKVDYDPSLLDLLFYSFYLPTFIDGPIFVYSDFHSQVKRSFKSSNFTPDVYDIVKQLIKLASWAVFIEFQFHFLYYSALSFHPQLIDGLPVWAVAAIGYCQGQFFMVKYLIMYGVAIQLSRFDGFVPLAVPRCISWVYSFTDMWKHFDVGLYIFIKTYIYVPLGGSRDGLPRQIFASGMVFAFIYFWHGAREEMFVWCVGNYLMGVLEATALVLKRSSVGMQLRSRLSPCVRLRLKAIIIFPVYLASGLQVIYFFFHMEVGWIFVSKMVAKASWTTLLTEFVFFTACIHNALYLVQRYKHKLKEPSDDK